MLAATLATLRAIPVVATVLTDISVEMTDATSQLDQSLLPDFGANFGRGGRRDVGAAQNQ